MPGVRRFQRTEETIAVRCIAGDVEAEQAIRGWLNLPVTERIPLHEGVWLAKRRGDEQVYIVKDEDFKEEFSEVITP